MTEILPDSFKNYITQEKLFNKNDLLLLAVSGGIDSVVLCDLCYSAGYKFIIAHCNFQLRGGESALDEAFVQTLGQKYNAQVLVKRFDTEAYAISQKCSTQVAARELRYAWFKEIMEGATGNSNKNVPAYLLTAHHADDNVETVLMNIFKGTGISGVRGILPKSGYIVRPLLFAHKKDLQLFLTQHSLAYREDSSNISDKYTRNYIRHNIVPAIEAVYPQAAYNINKAASHFRDAEVLYYQAIAAHKKKLVEFRNDEIHIPVLKLKQAVPLPTIIFEIVKPYGFTPAQTDEILKLLDSETGKFVLSQTHRILKNRNWVVISALNKTSSCIIVIDSKTDVIFFEEGKLTFTRKKFESDRDNIASPHNIALLDIKDIRFPLLLRKWKEGDYFYPLGMAKKKKIARFLIDQKASLSEKEKTWVLESDKKIVWILNRRIDDRFKVQKNTQHILQIELRGIEHG